MTETATETRTVLVERDFPFPPEKIWRALTQPHLIAEWLMQTDFKPHVGHRFKFNADWGSVDCEVLEIQSGQTLSYTWAAMGLVTTVTWTLTPRDGGTRLRMEQTGFSLDNNQAYNGARFGWQRFLGNLDTLLETME